MAVALAEVNATYGADPSQGISAIVVSYRSAATLDECLRRLRSSDDVVQIVVVDNASNDASPAIAHAHALKDARVSVMVRARNDGFGPACNRAARAAIAPWLAFVNPDCLVEIDSLARMRSALASVPAGGIIGADLADKHGVRDPAARRYAPSLARLLAGMGRRSSLDVPVAAREGIQSVEAVSGALLLMPHALFDATGGFDEGYRLHAEDLDLCRRVHDAGHAVLVANAVRVVHLRGVSSRTRPLFVEWHKHRGLWRYFRKFEGHSSGLARRLLAWHAIWAHFLVAAPRAWLRSLRFNRKNSQL